METTFQSPQNQTGMELPNMYFRQQYHAAALVLLLGILYGGMYLPGMTEGAWGGGEHSCLAVGERGGGRFSSAICLVLLEA